MEPMNFDRLLREVGSEFVVLLRRLLENAPISLLLLAIPALSLAYLLRIRVTRRSCRFLTLARRFDVERVVTHP